MAKKAPRDSFRTVKVSRFADALIQKVASEALQMGNISPAEYPLEVVNQAYAELNHAHNCLYTYMAQLEANSDIPRVITRRF